MVPFFVELFGKRQDAPRAEFDAVTASLAAFLDNVDNALGDIDDIRIKGYAPEFHKADPSPVSLCTGAKRYVCERENAMAGAIGHKAHKISLLGEAHQVIFPARQMHSMGHRHIFKRTVFANAELKP